MTVLCNICEEDTSVFAQCLDCKLRVCFSCLRDIYFKSNGQLFGYTPKVCVSCWRYFDEYILKYVAKYPDEKALFVGIHLQYSPWDEILKNFIKGILNPTEVLEMTDLLDMITFDLGEKL